MAGSGKVARYLVDLDVILDTRIATLALIDEAAATHALENGYHFRQIDDFEGVDREVFDKAYAARDETTLMNSTLSGFIFVLQKYLKEQNAQCIAMPYHDVVEVVLNTYPYVLDQEIREEIAFALEENLLGLAPVKLIHMSPEELTFAYCKSELVGMAMYDFYPWLNHHTAQEVKILLTDIFLMAPKLYKDRIRTQEELNAAKADCIAEYGHAYDTFEAMEILTGQVIGLTYIEPKFFSIINPLDADFQVGQTELEEGHKTQPEEGQVSEE